MYLDRRAERILNGEEGWAKAKALEVIVKVGEALGARGLIKVKHAHISGVSYSNIGDAGLRLIKSFADSGVKFSVPATVNPIGFDLENPNVFGVSNEYVKKQKEVLNSLRMMGGDLILSCTPYDLGVVQRYNLNIGDHVAWGESNAVVYANSLLGLKTNREGGPLALMAAISGYTYDYGMHIKEYRIPEIEYIVEEPKEGLNEALAGVLGEVIAGIHSLQTPPLVRVTFTKKLHLKEFFAALGTAGNIAMTYIPNFTPEPLPDNWKPRERVIVDSFILKSRLYSLRPRDPKDIDLIYAGCPHMGIEDLLELFILVKSLGKIRKKFIVSIPRILLLDRRIKEIVDELKKLGIIIVKDTCLVVSPLDIKDLRVLTNSYKAFYYLSRKGAKTYLAPIDELALTASFGG